MFQLHPISENRTLQSLLSIQYHQLALTCIDFHITSPTHQQNVPPLPSGLPPAHHIKASPLHTRAQAISIISTPFHPIFTSITACINIFNSQRDMIHPYLSPLFIIYSLSSSFYSDVGLTFNIHALHSIE